MTRTALCLLALAAAAASRAELPIDPPGKPNEDCYEIKDRLESGALPLAERAKYFRHYDPVIRRLAAFSLLREGARALPLILEALESKDPRVIRAGCDALAGPFGFEGRLRRQIMPAMPPAVAGKAAGHLARLLDHPDVYVREGALLALSNCGPAAAPYIEKVARLQDDPEWWVRSAAAHVLKNVGQPAADKALPGLLRNFHRERSVFARNRMRDAAIEIARTGRQTKAIVRALLQDLRGGSEYWRSQALDALAQIGPAAGEAAGTVREMLAEARKRLAAARTDSRRRQVEAQVARLEKTLEKIAPARKKPAPSGGRKTPAGR